MLTDSRKRAKILTDNRKSYHPIETLYEQRSVNDQIFNKNSVHVIIKECCPLYFFFQNIAINTEKRPFFSAVYFLSLFLDI